LTVPEVRRLLLALTDSPNRRGVRLGWSIFRRRHQAAAKHCHIARRTRIALLPTARGTPIILSAPVLLLTEARWEQIAPLLPPPKQQGRPAVDSYLLLAGILWIMRTAAPWRQMPEQFGPWQTAYTRYQDWQQSGLWTTILAILKADEPHTS